MAKFVGMKITDKMYDELENLKAEKGQWISTADLLRDALKEGLEKIKGD